VRFILLSPRKEGNEIREKIKKHAELTHKLFKYMCDKSPFPSDYIEAGLFHNVAALFFSSRKELEEINTLEIGMGRFEMSSIILECWNFPKGICDTVRYCSHPNYALSHDIEVNSLILNLAISLAAKKLGEEWYISIKEPYIELIKRAGLKTEGIEDFMERVVKKT